MKLQYEGRKIFEDNVIGFGVLFEAQATCMKPREQLEYPAKAVLIVLIVNIIVCSSKFGSSISRQGFGETNSSMVVVRIEGGNRWFRGSDWELMAETR